MPYAARDFTDADPNGMETTSYSFDFTSALGTGELIVSQAFTIFVASVSTGAGDPNPSSRLVGPPSLTGNIVSQLIGTLVAGNKYRIVATVMTSAGQTLSLYSYVECKTPP